MSISGNAYQSVSLHVMDAKVGTIFGIKSIAVDLFDLYDENNTNLYDVLNLCWQHKIYFLNQGLCWLLCRPGQGKEERHFLWLDWSIILRPSESDPNEFRAEILGRPLGKGSFGEVYRSAGMFVPKQDKRICYDNSPRVFKRQEHSEAHPLNEAETETAIARKAGYLHMKRLVGIDSKKSFMIMRHIEGVTLHQFLQDTQNQLDTNKRLMIALNALFAVKEQLHDHGIVSRDIKPDNMIINPATLQISNIDLGLAKLAKKDDKGESVGTLSYMSPEMLHRRGSDYYTDIYSLGFTLSEILGAEPLWAQSKTPFDESVPINFIGLFTGMDDLSPEHRNQIQKLIKRMTADNPRDRCTWQEAVHCIERIIMLRKLRHADTESCRQIRAGHHCGLLLRELIDPALLRNISGKTRDSISVLLDMLEANRKIIADTLPDHPLAIQQFVQAVRSQELSACTTRQALLDRLTFLTKEYRRKVELITQVIDRLVAQVALLGASDTELQVAMYRGLMSIQRAMDIRMQKYAPTIDNLPVVIKKLDKGSEELACLLKCYEQSLSSDRSASKPSVAGIFRVSPVQLAREARDLRRPLAFPDPSK